MNSLKDYRIVYMGTPLMSAEILESLIKDGLNIIAVIAQEDKPQGRKAILQKVPTKEVAEHYNIPVFQPHRIRTDFDFVKELKPDLILTMAYGQIIPQGLIDIPKYGCLNIHGSLLPKYRGAAPLQRAIINNEVKTGVTLMEMIDKMDAGKMFAFEECEILPEDNYSQLCKKIVECGIRLIRNNLEKYFKGELPGIEQNEKEVTFAEKILPEDEKLDLSKSCQIFINYVRALSDEPGAYFLVNNLKLKVFKAHQVSSIPNPNPGTLKVGKRASICLSDGEVELDEVQLEGKKRMDGKSFANGSHHLDGVIAK